MTYLGVESDIPWREGDVHWREGDVPWGGE